MEAACDVRHDCDGGERVGIGEKENKGRQSNSTSIAMILIRFMVVPRALKLEKDCDPRGLLDGDAQVT